MTSRRRFWPGRQGIRSPAPAPSAPSRPTASRRWSGACARRALPALLRLRGVRWRVLVVALVVAACGGSGGNSATPKQTAAPHAKSGGTLQFLYSGDVDNIDPGITYYTGGYLIVYATQRPLVNYKPDDPTHPVPDLAAQLPEVSSDNQTVTVKLRTGVKFSPPVNREITSADVKYGMERAFFKTVNNGYAGVYFGDIEGAKTGVAPGTQIKGIRTPDPHTVVFKLTRASGGVLA